MNNTPNENQISKCCEAELGYGKPDGLSDYFGLYCSNCREPQVDNERQGEEKCYSCSGKGTYSQIHGEQGFEDFGGEGYIEAPSIHNYPCSACNGTGLKYTQPEVERHECPHGAEENDCPVINCANSKIGVKEIGIGDKLLPYCSCSSLLERLKGENNVCDVHKEDEVKECNNCKASIDMEYGICSAHRFNIYKVKEWDWEKEFEELFCIGGELKIYDISPEYAKGFTRNQVFKKGLKSFITTVRTNAIKERDAEIEKIIGKHNARILNEFQKQGTADMPFIAYDERICLIPAMKIATEETINSISNSRIRE